LFRAVGVGGSGTIILQHKNVVWNVKLSTCIFWWSFYLFKFFFIHFDCLFVVWRHLDATDVYNSNVFDDARRDKELFVMLAHCLFVSVYFQGL
jgi:hypothetical protein